jgi:Rod binding domain-containing protein
MEIPPLQPRVRADELPLERLATHPGVADRDKVAELTRQFEAVLLRQILREAQKAVWKSRFNPESVAGGIYRDLVTEQLAGQISRHGGLGVGQALAAQLDRELKPAVVPPGAPARPH